MPRQPTFAGDGQGLSAQAVVFEEPLALTLRQLRLAPPEHHQVLVDVCWSGISTGTEKLLWTGQMPTFPGMGYPLVPGYETVGKVITAGRDASVRPGDTVFVAGARCYGEIRGLFGGASSRLVADSDKVMRLPEPLAADGILLALAATAHHALHCDGQVALPGLIVGHGVLGRLLARICIALGGPPPIVWEQNPGRRHGAEGYDVVDPASDQRRDYRRALDASGDVAVLDQLVARLAPAGEIVIAGFYSQPLSINFPPAFMREARFRIAAEWQPQDLRAVSQLVSAGSLSLANLITHTAPASDASAAYPIAFSDPDCLKMVLDWRNI